MIRKYNYLIIRMFNDWKKIVEFIRAVAGYLLEILSLMLIKFFNTISYQNQYANI